MKIHESVFVAPGSTIVGDVEIGENSSVWYGAVIRGDKPIRIGKNCSIQDNAVFHAEYDHEIHMGDNVTVGHGAIVHGCTVGDNTLIGMGAIILNDAVVGKNCIIGAGSLVTGRKVIPDGSLVMGSPAVIKREVTSQELEGNLASAEHYVELGRQYKERYS